MPREIPSYLVDVPGLCGKLQDLRIEERLNPVRFFRLYGISLELLLVEAGYSKLLK